MRFPWANSLILLLLAVLITSGFSGFISGNEQNRWMLWTHGAAAYGLAFLLLWKGAIIIHAYRRKINWTIGRIVFALMSVLVLIIYLFGLIWTFSGPVTIAGFSLISLHIYLALAFTVVLVWHIWRLRWIARVPQARDRRVFLRLFLFGGAGIALTRSAEVMRQTLGLAGFNRRFTGSYEAGSFSGAFPSVSWIADRPNPVEISKWTLNVSGAVQNPLRISWDDLAGLEHQSLRATLDCTGGWFTRQEWQGIPLSRLLEICQPDQEAMSVTIESVTGYRRRFSLASAAGFLLATAVNGDFLSHGHGFPLRLVAPGERGVNWVKWITVIRVNESSALWQPPLPMQ